MDELVKYEFMEEVQQELFDGSTAGKTLKEAGFDFDQRLNFFQGTGSRFKVTGFTFGVENQDQLFEVFDDFQQIDSDYDGVTFYQSYFNRIAIKGSSAIVFRVQGHSRFVEKVTDSIWYARGNDYPWYSDMYEEWYEENETELTDVFDGTETVENTNTPSGTDELPPADEDPTEKTYYELRDSVELEYHEQCIKRLCDELFLRNETLLNEDSRFGSQLTHNVDGIFYLDNERNYKRDESMKYFQMLYPVFSANMEQLYDGNIILGDLSIQDNSIALDLTMNYSDDLGSIYTEMTDTKFDKNVLKYIHKDNNAFFTQNINLRKAYEKAYEVVMPMITESEGRISLSAITLELIDELINKDAVFGVYQGSMFGAYNGVMTIKTKKIIFDYNEENFEYIEQEVEAEEDMPVFTMGFTTKRGDIPEMVLNRMAKIYDRLTFTRNYWVLEDAILNSAPLYFMLKNDLFIVTNDGTLAKENPNGYGSLALSKKEAKRARKSGTFYGHVDAGRSLSNLPTSLFSESENEIIDVVRGKSGTMEITSTKASNTEMNFKLDYQFEGEYESTGTYFLDLINSLYVISK